jgi:hypothetical protein
MIQDLGVPVLILIAVLSFFILLSVVVPKTLRSLYGKVSITIVWVLLVASCLGIIVCPAIFIFEQVKHGLRGVGALACIVWFGMLYMVVLYARQVTRK